ncbi:MAG: hypothetical protein JWO38_2240 [Gemmataceae bacterium]|nr:hypothetical protein [Gemmataceae bacterium]
MLPGRLRHLTPHVVACLVVAVAGCQPAVREDRTIVFGPDGVAAFQHGRNGVFVTDAATGKPRQIYEPGADDLATSPPAWDPAGKRMVFAVARPVDGNRYEPMGDAPADGRRYPGVPVRYTCWLHDPAGAGGRPEKLFEATCGHAGSVAAGLAVCWHPDGQRLDYVDQPTPNQHRVFAFDLTARGVEPVPLPAAEHVALGSRPAGRHRAAVLGGAEGQSGLWVEEVPGGGWWRVPNSAPETARLEELRRLRPQWSPDGKKVAFVAGATLRVCDTATRQTDTWFHAERPSHDFTRPPHLSDGLHWHPDGTRVGLIDGTRLGLVGPTGWLGTLSDSPVVSFAGWEATGRRMAYVTTEPLPYAAAFPHHKLPAAEAGAPAPDLSITAGLWATLFAPNPAARTAVWFAGAGGGTPRKVVSGVRATFPHWSPTEPRLSVWLTVEPPYRLTPGARVGMRPGDPAALIDAETGDLVWLPVNGSEHAQIGHVELRLGRIDAALRRFDEAAAGLPPAGPADWMFFRAVALRKAGREADSVDAGRRFVPPAATARGEQDRMLLSLMASRVRVPEGDIFQARHRFAAEAFASLEMAAEGIEFLRREFAEARSDRDRLSASVALCQVLLLADRRAEYADHVVDELLPLAARVFPTAGRDREAVSGAIAVTVLPLAVTEFTAPLPDRLVRRVCERVGASPAGEDDVGFAYQLVLRASARRLGEAALAERAGARLATHPARSRWELSAGGEVDIACLLRIRVGLLLPELLGEALRGAFGE